MATYIHTILPSNSCCAVLFPAAWEILGKPWDRYLGGKYGEGVLGLIEESQTAAHSRWRDGRWLRALCRADATRVVGSVA